MSDEALRARIRQAVLQRTSMVGMGMACPHCGGDWNSFFNTLKNPSTWAERLTNEIVNPNSDLKTKVIPGVQKALKIAEEVAPKVREAANTLGIGSGRWSPEARLRARQRAANPNSHAAKVKAYMKEHGPGVKLADASRAVAVRFRKKKVRSDEERAGPFGTY